MTVFNDYRWVRSVLIWNYGQRSRSHVHVRFGRRCEGRPTSTCTAMRCRCFPPAVANFRTVFSESQNTSPLNAEIGPDFNAKWPFKVIRFGVNEEPLMGYIVQYNNCGLECEGSEWYSERKKQKSPFTTTPLSFDAPSLANPREYPHKSYLSRN